MADINKPLAHQAEDTDEARYRTSSAALVGRGRAGLADAFDKGDPVAVTRALGSVADMMNGLIDIGADFPQSSPCCWKEASNIADLTHKVEQASRGIPDAAV